MQTRGGGGRGRRPFQWWCRQHFSLIGAHGAVQLLCRVLEINRNQAVLNILDEDFQGFDAIKLAAHLGDVACRAHLERALDLARLPLEDNKRLVRRWEGEAMMPRAHLLTQRMLVAVAGDALRAGQDHAPSAGSSSHPTTLLPLPQSDSGGERLNAGFLSSPPPSQLSHDNSERSV